MFHRVCYAWLASFIAILGYEALYFIYKRNAQMAHRLVPQILMSVREAVLVLSCMFYYAASAMIGALLAVYSLSGSLPDNDRLIAETGLVLGLWSLAIFLQIALNMVRRCVGAPRKPVIYINKNAFTFARRKKDADK